MKFTHLHVHSHYSLLDGLPKIPDLVNAVQKKGMDAVALTDHGVLYGALEFYKTCKRAGVKPIIGIEAYVAARDLEEKTAPAGSGRADYFHMILLAKNNIGYQNLLKLVTAAHLEGYYYKPRIDKKLLARHSAGLIGLSGCLRGEIARYLASGNSEMAKKTALEMAAIFEPDSFYLELQRNLEDGVQETVNDGLIKLSRETNIPVVATGDAHYLEPEDNGAQDILVCIGTGTTVEQTDRLDMRRMKLHLATPDEMAERFADIPEAVANTEKIAAMIDLELVLEKKHFPAFPVPEGYSADSYLEMLAWNGIKQRHGDGELPKEIADRLGYEMDVIKKKGYSGYFLVVADFVNWSRARGIISTTRGSAAGSLVAYALGITTMNPIEYKLPFERFLNPYRPTPPDIDMDFADNRRDEVLSYVSDKYGKDKVAQIVTFGTMMARAAVRDVGRALGVPYSKCDRIAKMIPIGKQGFHMTIEKALSLAPDLREAYDKDQETKNLITLARKVEGSARHASVHAAGVVIAPTSLTDYTPLQMDSDNQNVITQYDMHSVEDAGLVKMDFLGIRNLSILGNAIEIVRESRGINVDLQTIPLDDAKTYNLLASGRTMGVFQLGGSGMTKYLVDLKPTNIFDIMAMISLYRPGPMESIPQFIERKHNPDLIHYLDPRLKEILDMSYGVITYQEDVLLTAINVAGYTWEEADKLRKAMGKKIPKEMAAQKEKFIQGAITGGVSSDKAVKLWALIEPFAAYGFGKAHAASYAMVAYQTAYMKANFPVEFMAAVMTAESGDNEKIAVAVGECASLEIEVLPPDVNESLANFTAINQKQIRFGLNAIKNLGSDVIETIITERKLRGPFVSLGDFVRRMRTRNFNKKSWEALVKSGSLDRYGERNQLLLNTEIILEYARSEQKQLASGQSMLLGGASAASEELLLKDSAPAADQERLSWEKEFLGLYVSAHPLRNHRETLLKYCKPISSLSITDESQSFTIGGILTRIQNILTKKGDQMCFADIEDEGGKLELVVFPNVFIEHKQLLAVDQMLLVRGKVSDKDGEIKLLVDSMKLINDPDVEKWVSSKRTSSYSRPTTPHLTSPTQGGGNNAGAFPPPGGEGLREGGVRILKIKIPKAADPLVFSKLKIVFNKFPGEVAVSLVIPDREGVEREIKTDFAVASTDAFKTELRELLRESIIKA